MMINVPRLRKELEFVTAHPQEWEQACWIGETSCGTVACLAGWTVLHAGYELHQENHSFVLVSDDDPAGRRAVGRHDDGTVVVSVRDVARELLRLDDREADRLFHPLNDLRELWLVASRLTDGELEVPPAVLADAV